MNEEELKKAVNFYRSLVEKELKKEKKINGKLVGPKELTKKDYIDLKDIIHPERPFLGKEAADDLDTIYVTILGLEP